ncbi:CHAP domain-containing protein [Sulfitobacter aestuariivivens]|uniref:CHAP domain-containing protein n=1 Tax=Sulfitobacter aestuariivivens TaxID=2766981 RepID=A0A927HFU1_9RHOB|nr:CHAP domain-containing protein [Sulfitobacter aestuariivivens]MBD3664779.1 CHAP domain-containing protein [Sulfitobacter aestuariivivens]
MNIYRAGRAVLSIAALAALTACAAPKAEFDTLSSLQIDPEMQALALREVAAKHARGQRVWCVPFARDASGVQIRGNANTWWGQADGLYARGNKPAVGSVMTWKATSKNPRGHVAVVSQIISDREIKVDHANWRRNQVSLKMSVIDISPKGDWSQVKLESQPGSYGRMYPIKGFIYPTTAS